MVYVFTSSAAASVTYTGAVAEEILRLAGKRPGPRGVITVAEIDAVIERLKAAARAVQEQAAAAGTVKVKDEDEEADTHTPAAVPLDLRLVPFLELLERSRAAGKDVTWGL